jgi:phospholipid/cholesterol/gamma-HCH transport system substrate-binding protein
MGPVLRRITMNFPPLLFHPINSITAYKGQIIYDTPQTEAKAETPVPYLQWQSAPGVSGPKPSAATDLSSLMVPPEQSTSHAGGPEAAPAPAPGSADPNAPAAPPPAGPLPAEGGG